VIVGCVGTFWARTTTAPHGNQDLEPDGCNYNAIGETMITQGCPRFGWMGVSAFAATVWSTMLREVALVARCHRPGDGHRGVTQNRPVERLWAYGEVHYG
jgi:hypothetical protein